MKSTLFTVKKHACRACVLAAATFALSACAHTVEPGTPLPDDRAGHNWVGVWGAAPAGPPFPAAMQTFTDQTLRLIVHTSIGGNQVRIRLSNERGATPLKIGAVHVALRGAGADTVAGSDRALTFGGFSSITIPAGAPALSDPVALSVPALSDLAVSLHLPGEVQASTIHNNGYQTNYVSMPGNFTGAAAFPTQRNIFSWPFLTEVVVQAYGSAVVVLGDSITDGALTARDANKRWPDLLALRLQTRREVPAQRTDRLVRADTPVGIVNRGIGGNRLLRGPATNPLAGASAVARFDRDVLATAGVRHVIVLLGMNDIGAPGTAGTLDDQAVMVDEMIAGYRQLIARAHAKGLAIYGGTITPFEGAANPGFYTLRKELVRQAVNHWIRSSQEFDAVIDFDRAVRDPSHPSRILPALDSGDHVHPNDEGMQAMANAISLDLFRTAPLVRRLLPGRSYIADSK